MLNADYSSALSLLLRYPSPDPHAPLAFVYDGLYLEQNPSPRRGKFLISKYSGKPPESPRRPSQLGMRSTSSRSLPLRSDSRDFSDSSSPGRPSARSSPKNLEALLQDVSEGIQRRTESWSVAKAVRGAVSEAKRNIQSVQAERNFRIPITGDISSLNPANLSFARDPQIDLKMRIEHLEERNKALAKTLSQVLNDLRSHLMNAKGLDAGTNSAMKQAFERVQSVQTCLEDSSIPIGSTDRPPDTEDDLFHDRLRQRRSPPGKDEGEQSFKDTKPTDSAAKSPPPIDTGPKKVGSLPGFGNESAFSMPLRSTTRPSLADSGFSWMLEGSRHLSGFVSSSSVPPEQARHNETKVKHNPLFGNGGEEGQRQPSTEFDGLAMSSLRGSKSRD